VALSPPDRPAALGRLARLYPAQGRGGGHPLLERLSTLQPDDLRARSDLATALVRIRQLGRARPLFEEILRKDPQNLVALATLGSLFESEGRADEARAFYERYLLAHPPDDRLTAEVRARAGRLGSAYGSR
jgi:cytochrome c-type biogenesis protein CcmH/NrfG